MQSFISILLNLWRGPKITTDEIRWVLFDEDCGFCQNSVNRFQRWGAGYRLSFIPNRPEAEQVQDLLAQTGLQPSDCANAIVMVHTTNDGELIGFYRGAACVNQILRQLPGVGRNRWLRLLSGLYDIPLIRPLEDLGYRWVAANRHRFGGTAQCALPSN